MKEAPWPMLAPMIALAGLCVLFGVYNPLPIDKLIAPIVAGRGLDLPVQGFSGFPANGMLVLGTLVVLALALLNHLYGAKKTGRGLGAVDHIHHAPGLRNVYAAAEKGYLDPYNIGMYAVRGFARVAWWIDRAVYWVQETGIVAVTRFLSGAIRKAHTGRYSRYILWSLAGAAGILVWMTLSL